MIIKCENCGESFERDNIAYGTRCTYCDYVIKSHQKPQFVTEAEMKKKMLQEEMLEKLRKNIQEKK